MYKLFIASLLVMASLNAAEYTCHVTKKELDERVHEFERAEKREIHFCYAAFDLCLGKKCGCFKTAKQFFKEYRFASICVSIPWYQLEEFAQILSSAGNYRELTIKNGEPSGKRYCWYATDDLYKLTKVAKKNPNLEKLYLVSAYETSLGTFLFTNLFNECPNIKTLQYNNNNNKASFTRQA